MKSAEVNMKLYSNTSIINIQTILDAIQRYNGTFGHTISVSDDNTYYMYGYPEASEEICVGLLCDLAASYEKLSADSNLNDDEIFGSILEDATDEAAETVITPETAFQSNYEALKNRYNFS